MELKSVLEKEAEKVFLTIVHVLCVDNKKTIPHHGLMTYHACASKGRPLLKALQIIAIFCMNRFPYQVDLGTEEFLTILWYEMSGLIVILSGSF